MWWHWTKVLYLAIAGTTFFWLMIREEERIGFTEVLAGIIVGGFWPIFLIAGWFKALKKR